MLRPRVSPRVPSSHVPAPAPPTSMISLPRVPFASLPALPALSLASVICPQIILVLPAASVSASLHSLHGLTHLLRPRISPSRPPPSLCRPARSSYHDSPIHRPLLRAHPSSVPVFTLHTLLCSSPTPASPASIATHDHALFLMDVIFCHPFAPRTSPHLSV
ncbi:hypothetical protein C8R44DRAFT_885539 [Mycena epipterygia]|nr:hypothetical protein C8R44DRAFT_885539 [Mycena epipterygia]